MRIILLCLNINVVLNKIYKKNTELQWFYDRNKKQIMSTSV